MKRYILLSTALLIFPFSVSVYAAEIGCGEIVAFHLNNVWDKIGRLFHFTQ